MSTIAAISSPIGAGGIGIVRVSGNEALRIADAIFIFAHKKASQDASFVMPEGVKQQWTPLFMNYGTFDAGEFCDKGYAVYFPANARTRAKIRLSFICTAECVSCKARSTLF